MKCLSSRSVALAALLSVGIGTLAQNALAGGHPPPNHRPRPRPQIHRPPHRPVVIRPHRPIVIRPHHPRPIVIRPHYPHGPRFPHCPGNGPIHIVKVAPCPVSVPVTPGAKVYNLQCALEAGETAQGLSAVNLNIVDSGNGRFQVSGMYQDQNKTEKNLRVNATGTLDDDLALTLEGGAGEITLRTEKDEQGEEFMLGKINLQGAADEEGLSCTLDETQG